MFGRRSYCSGHTLEELAKNAGIDGVDPIVATAFATSIQALVFVEPELPVILPQNLLLEF